MNDDPLDYTDAATHLLECLDATTSDAVRGALIRVALMEAHWDGMHHMLDVGVNKEDAA
jgi:hypothetical protein